MLMHRPAGSGPHSPVQSGSTTLTLSGLCCTSGHQFSAHLHAACPVSPSTAARCCIGDYTSTPALCPWWCCMCL